MGCLHRLRHDQGMIRLSTLIFALFALWRPVAAQDWRASPWIDFKEASLRLLMLLPKDGAQAGEAGLEIRLAEGYKTYWRSPGDSGAPPVFDFSASIAVGSAEVDFPFPSKFDDGAGGMAWGYKEHVILPIRFLIMPGQKPILAFKLDFAVCGSMCIPLATEMRFDPASGQPLGAADQERYENARRAVPKRLSPEENRALARVVRLAGGNKPKWRVELASALDPARLSAFPEAKGYLSVEAAQAAGDGRLSIIINGEAMPGSGGLMGPARLTFGEKGQSFEAMLDLDGAPNAQ